MVGVTLSDGTPRSLDVDGSSTVFPLTQAVAESFSERDGARVAVGVSGTGGGFRRLCRGEVPVVGASRPINAVELADCATNGVDFVELPIAFDGIVVALHPANDWVDHLTLRDLRRIWMDGGVDRWSELRPDWPDAPIRLFGPGPDSGTHDYFVRAVLGDRGARRVDYVASEDDAGLVRGVAGDRFALGFFGYAWYRTYADRLRAAPITVDGNARPVVPTAEAIADGTYRPLARPVFLYVDQGAALDRSDVRAFVELALSAETRGLAREVGYVPLPKSAVDRVRTRFRSGIHGSHLGANGAVVGLTLEGFGLSVR